MKIVITGAGGLVGSHLVRRLAVEHEVVALKHRDLDITHPEAVRRRIVGEKPALVINCAVVSVDDCERNPDLAQAINVEGPRALAESARDIGAAILHFSTNYVFDGEKTEREPYTTEDRPSPINVYGRTKAAGEEAVRENCARASIIRTSWIYGVGGENFLSRAPRDLAAAKEVCAVTDVWASTTYVADLSMRVLEILARGRYGVYHVVNEGICSYYEFAVDAGRLLGLSEVRIAALVEAINEEDAKRLARRPRYTPMRCRLSEAIGLPPLRHWRLALADYVRRLAENRP
ncbi:MAG: dTDP-4-dehydrorhamnose reductase [Deltaproteobacteria bacterium]|nr:dTDP-4-dehydrorhamnose reductase [Deltaproteobacteria bacterium]